MVTDHTFKVTDSEAFKKALEEAGVNEAQKASYDGLCYEQQADGSFWIGGFDASIILYTDEDEEIDITKIIQKFLAPGEHTIIFCVGQEKLAAVDGSVYIITKDVNLYKDLGTVAKELLQQAGVNTPA